MKRKVSRIYKLFRWCVAAAALTLLFVAGLALYIKHYSEPYIFDSKEEVPKTYTALVLGASVKSNGQLSTMLRDRVQSTLLLYRAGKVQRFLLSGDNGTTFYNEPQAMKNYLLEHNVPEKDIFLDFAGFDTYDSVYRASYIFEVDHAIIITQQFHLKRAVYIARKMGLNYYGYEADRRDYPSKTINGLRELIANVKAWAELLVEKEPYFKGEKVPITGQNNT
ncbi:MAG: ElyC/SanA/YdcF family protein [Leeuwenhoekiella sp.]